MGRILFVRIVAVVSGLLVASFIAFPSFPSTGFLSFTSTVAVDRTLKGDRLPPSRSHGQNRDAGAVRTIIAREDSGRLRSRLQPGLVAAAGQRVSALHGVTKIRTI